MPHAPPKAGPELGTHRPPRRTSHGHRDAPVTLLAAGAAERPARQLPAAGDAGPARSPLVQSTTCLGLHWVTGSMVSGFPPSCAGYRPVACARGPFPGGRAPQLVPAGPSRLHGRGQRVIPARLSRGSAAPSPAPGTACGASRCHRPAAGPPPPPPPRGPGRSCCSRATAAVGRGGATRTLAPARRARPPLP